MSVGSSILATSLGIGHPLAIDLTSSTE